MKKPFAALLPSYLVDLSFFGPQSHRAFEVRDDSMSDGSRYSYEHGDIVIASQIPYRHWWSQIFIYHYDFIIVPRTGGPLLRRVSYHDPGNGLLTLHSLNSLYDDLAIDISEVCDIYNVIKVSRAIEN